MTFELMKEQSFKNIDESILIFIAKHLRTEFFTKIAVGITTLGSPALLLFFNTGYLINLFIKKDKLAALFLAMNVICATIWMFILKNIIARERPHIVPRLIKFTGLSYPSGHSLVSTATYLSIAFLFCRHVNSKIIRIIILCLTAFIILLIGFSRLYLGVHYPSDVLGGIIFGISLVLWSTAFFKSFSTF